MHVYHTLLQNRSIEKKQTQRLHRFQLLDKTQLFNLQITNAYFFLKMKIYKNSGFDLSNRYNVQFANEQLPSNAYLSDRGLFLFAVISRATLRLGLDG